MSSSDGDALSITFAPGAALDAPAIAAAIAEHDALLERLLAESDAPPMDIRGPLLHLSRKTRLTRVRAGDLDVVVKEYLPGKGIRRWAGSRLGRFLRGDRARVAFAAGLACVERGVPVPAPLAHVVRTADARPFLLAEHFGDDAEMLYLWLRRYADAAPGSEPDRERRRLARAVGRFLATLHAAGVDPDDLAAQNVLVRGHDGSLDGFAVALIDWDGIHLTGSVGHARRVRHLTHVADLPDYVPVRALLQGLRAYRAAGGGPIGRRDLRAIRDGIDERARAKAERARQRAAGGSP